MVWREAFLDCELLGLDGLEYGLVMVSLNRSYPTSKKHMIYDDYIYIYTHVYYIFITIYCIYDIKQYEHNLHDPHEIFIIPSYHLTFRCILAL